MYNTSQFGICCPSDTPEGESVGLVKNLALLAEITLGSESINLPSILKSLGVMELNGVFSEEG